ncbi:MAG TPA: peptidase M28, partial [Gemmatimonadales bacterium]
MQSITAADLLEHTKVLAGDDFEGRAPGTPGEEKTVQYLTERFEAMGLAPGNPDGSWVQAVDLVGFTASPTASFAVGRGQRTIPLRFPDDYVAVSRRTAEQVDVVDSDLVFVGYGVVAPEYQWDDYKDLDVRGKTIVMLINDPPVPDSADSRKLDSTVFRGSAMTY